MINYYIIRVNQSDFDLLVVVVGGQEMPKNLHTSACTLWCSL